MPPWRSPPAPPSLPPLSPPDAEGATTALDISLVVAVLLVALLLELWLKSSKRLHQFLTGSGACMLLGAAFVKTEGKAGFGDPWQRRQAWDQRSLQSLYGAS